MNQKLFGLLQPKKSLLFLMIVAFMMAALAPSVTAEEKPAESGWEFHIAPYLWAISMDGNAGVKGLDFDVDMPFSDIWDQLNFALMLAYEARKGPWGLWGDTIYANLGDDNVGGPRGLTNIEPTVKVFWQGLGGYYRLGTWDLSNAPGKPGKKTPTVTVDTYAGLRYTYLDLKLDFKGIFRNRVNDVSDHKSWVEPLVGARTIWGLSERWTVTLAGDIGGFGMGSDFAWDAFGLIGYRFGLFGEDNARVLAGYRALSQDYTDGSGRDKFKWDITMYGPILGLDIGF